MLTADAKAFEAADVIHATCACANDGCSVFSSAFSSVLVGRAGKTLQEKEYCGREALDAFSFTENAIVQRSSFQTNLP